MSPNWFDSSLTQTPMSPYWQKFSSLAALEVVKMTTSSDENFVNIDKNLGAIITSDAISLIQNEDGKLWDVFGELQVSSMFC